MEDFLYCKLCLVTDVKMYTMNSSIIDVYTELLQLPVIIGHTYYICYECLALLQKYKDFYEKCVEAHRILDSISLDHSQVTKEDVETINRKECNLESVLTQSSTENYSERFPHQEHFNKYYDNLIFKDVKLEIKENKVLIEGQQEKTYNLLIDDSVMPTSEMEFDNSGDELSDYKDILHKSIHTSTKTKDQKIVKNEDHNLILPGMPLMKTEFDDFEDQVLLNHNGASIYKQKNTPEETRNQKIDRKKDSVDLSDYDENIISPKNTPTRTKKRKIVKNEDHNSDDLLPDDELLSDYDEEILPPTHTTIKTKKREIVKMKDHNSITFILDEETRLSDISFSDLDDEPPAKQKPQNKKTNVSKIESPKIDDSYFEGYATVVQLTPEDAEKELLLRKESSNYKNCELRCEFCYRGFEAKAAFDNHMKKHSLDYGNWECEFCHLRFLKSTHLYRHRISSHKNKYCCNKCPYSCFSKHQAKMHVSLHKGKKYPCGECGKIFSMPNTLLMHRRVKHERECVCALCGSTFSTPRGLFVHTMKLHRQEKNEENGPKCDDCGVQFASEVAWNRHLVLKHKIGNGCEHCGEMFPNSDSLKIHLKIHARRKPVKRIFINTSPIACTICNVSYTRKEYMSHLKTEHLPLEPKDQKQCICEVCGKVLKSPFTLKCHQRTHSGERPFKCRECGKTFAAPSVLYIHNMTHTRDRRFACNMCHSAFYLKSSLGKHVRAHLGIRPHRCPICDKSFPSRCEVKVHIKYVHNKEPWPKRDRTKRKACARKSISLMR